MRHRARHNVGLALTTSMILMVAACGQEQPAAQTETDRPAQHPITKDIGTGVEVDITLPKGWSGEPRGGYVEGPAGAGIIAFNDREYVGYGDACEWSTTRPKVFVTTAEVLVDQLSKQNRRVASGPTDVTVDGKPGKKVILEMADDVTAEGEAFPDCDDEKFALLGVKGEEPGRWSQGKGQVEEVWAIDVGGTIAVLIGLYFPETPAEQIDEVRGALASMTFTDTQ